MKIRVNGRAKTVDYCVERALKWELRKEELLWKIISKLRWNCFTFDTFNLTIGWLFSSVDFVKKVTNPSLFEEKV